jgi:MvdD-like protein with pre-ATP grasp domain
MIVIITAPSDLHADDVEGKLRARRLPVFRFDPERFPRHATATIRYAGTTKRVSLRVDGATVDLTTAVSAWWRRPGLPVIHEGILDSMSRQYARHECIRLMDEIWHLLDVRWLPGAVWAMRLADCKPAQLQLAATLGFDIPPTLITNRAEDFLAFHREHSGEVIDKMPSVVFPLDRNGPFHRYTQRVTTRDVGYVGRLRFSPMLFQPNIKKALEVRVTVVGSRVMAAEIHSQATAHTLQDWRRYDHGRTPYRVHDLPAEVHDRCVALVSKLGLRYGAIDLILTPAGRYVFLEVNPNGQWLWVEHKTGLPITEAVCDLLQSDLVAAEAKSA